MRWSERQRAMLREIGVRVFAPPPSESPGEPQRARLRRRPAMLRPSLSSAAPAAAVQWLVQRRRRLPRRNPVPPMCAAASMRSTGPNCARRSARAGPARCARRVAQTVFGVGHPRAHWMIVGEAPANTKTGRASPSSADRAAARQHAARARPDARSARPERQVFIANTLEVPAAGQPQPAARRDWRVRAVSRAPDRAGAAARHPRDGTLRGAGAAAQRRADRPAARARARVPRRAGDRHLPPGLPAAQPARQGARLGRPVPGRRPAAALPPA